MVERNLRQNVKNLLVVGFPRQFKSLFKLYTTMCGHVGQTPLPHMEILRPDLMEKQTVSALPAPHTNNILQLQSASS